MPGCDIAIRIRSGGSRSSGNSAVLESARQELASRCPGRLQTSRNRTERRPRGELQTDGIRLKTVDGNIVVTRADDRGVLYGAFALLRKIALGEPIADLDEKSKPRLPCAGSTSGTTSTARSSAATGAAPFSGTTACARGSEPRNDYGRLLASLGINGCVDQQRQRRTRASWRRTFCPSSRALPNRCGRGACAR